MVLVWKAEKPKNDVDSIPLYAPGTAERELLLGELERLQKAPEEIPLFIGGRRSWEGEIQEIRSPADNRLILGRARLAGEKEIDSAVESALQAWKSWSSMPWRDRAAVFQKAADLLAGPRRTRNIASIMLNLSKTPYEAEIDLAELVDFWRFNAWYLHLLYGMQPEQARGEINRFDWRPLEGFVFAVSPFNFYSIAGNLPTAPALAGNVAVWKPARAALACNWEIMKVLEEAGLPAGVINFVPFSSRYAPRILEHPDFAGLHFTGSYDTFMTLWRTIGKNVDLYRSFPRVVGETGGKDFAVVHASADPRIVAVSLLRGGFEYQGQKCSALSRAYIPESLWPEIRKILLEEIPRLRVGPTSDLGCFMGALIDEDAYRKTVRYIEYALSRPEEYERVFGGSYRNEEGWFVEPTLFVTNNPHGKLMREEIFGPVVTVFVYPDERYGEILELCDSSTPYALTGSIFARDREAIQKAACSLRFAAGNFYINDKPTGAIVGRQPFGGSRHSGTNDKAGFLNNITRWLSPRTIKETTVPPTDWRRPYLG
ncbi:MAG TPA: L-glutamate gamma-semialdehyde dehydrogenase [Synergistales bacterium]|nr:L-glutamate gamma-semialdehyde dehydrogenase [Synergistales bacterium]